MSDPDPGGRENGSEQVLVRDPRRVDAIVALLLDDNPRVREGAERALRTAGLTSAELRAAAERLDDAPSRARARARIETIRFEAIERELERVVKGGAPLEAGAFLLARVVYPDLDAAAYAGVLDGMAGELRERIPSTPLRAKARALRDFLHGQHGFRGNVDAYDDPENALLNRVIDRRTGIPTSLACVYLLLGRRLSLPLEGVNLPRHFLVRCADDEDETFIDAFASGRFLTRGDCRQFLLRAGIEARPELLLRASDRAVLSRLARSLAESFRAHGQAGTATRFERCLTIVGGAGGAP